MIIIGSTIPAFKMDDTGYWWAWLQNADRIVAKTESEIGVDVEFVATLQYDGRGKGRFDELFRRIEKLKKRGVRDTKFHTYWFSFESDTDELDPERRFFPICTGRNMVIEHALVRPEISHIYFADADIGAPDDIIVKLLELEWPVTGANVPTYGLGREKEPLLDGNQYIPIKDGMDVRVYWNTAGSLLVAREVFRRVPWRWDPDADSTDDPATQEEMRKLGWPTLVRHDIECVHFPQGIMSVQYRGHDMKVYPVLS